MWKLKLNADGTPVMQDGKYVFVKEDGSDVVVDVAGTFNSMAALRNEAKTYREAKEAAEANLAKFANISDPAAALDALDKLSKIDQKKLIDSGEVDRVRAEISRGFETKLQEANTKTQTLEQQLYAEKVGGAFGRSKYVADRLAIPPDLVQARFGQNFSMEDGKIVAKDSAGNKLYSPSNPGALADFDEALGMLVEQYPHKEHILKASGASGGGARNSVAATGGKRTLTRAQFEQLDPQSRAKEVQAGTVVSD